MRGRASSVTTRLERDTLESLAAVEGIFRIQVGSGESMEKERNRWQ